MTKQDAVRVLIHLGQWFTGRVRKSPTVDDVAAALDVFWQRDSTGQAEMFEDGGEAQAAGSPECEDFDGETFDPVFDKERLGKQMRAVYDFMVEPYLSGSNGESPWFTLSEIQEAVWAETQSISARLRDLRKVKFGSHVVARRRRGDPKRGVWEYRVEVPDDG